ncbi:Uncharacterised protein [Yersinia mollaretii]|uniref:hypothetical protein n=1 Tax=Yersinia mollaretii TaxID=33060 RepID=UPI0005DC29A9|nr:hypothetical protein [Yersinia mollaretii]CNK33151.1 Uncharacterised protein [Yersinia mollaretii]
MATVSSIIYRKNTPININQRVEAGSTKTTGHFAKNISQVKPLPAERRQPQLEKHSTSQDIPRKSEAPIVRPKIEGSLADVIVNTTLKTVNSDIKPAMMPETFLSELTAKLANRNGEGLAENRASQIPNKITEEIIKARVQYALKASERALAEKKEDARVAEALNAKTKLALEAANAAKAKAESDQVMAVLVFDKNGVPLPPPPQFPPMGVQTKLSPKPDDQAKEARKPVATAKQAMMQSGVIDELILVQKRMNSHNSVVAENKTNKFTNKITEEIAQAKAKYVLDAPTRVSAEEVEDARVAEGLKAEGKLALEAINVAKVNAEADQLKAPLVYDANNIPVAPPLPPTP